MNAFKAHYFDGRTSRMHEVEVSRPTPERVRIVGDEVDREEALATLRISPRLARTVRTIELPDGARLMVWDDARLDAWFPQQDRLQRLVDRLERHAHAVAASILVCLVMGLVIVFWGIPWMSDRIAAQVPAGVEAKLGDEVLGQLDRFFGFAASKIERARQEALAARFAALADGLPDNTHYRLLFRDAPNIGPNALAVPGGAVVVTDQLLGVLDDDREFDAVVAHEIGHQQHRHALRQTLRSSFVLVVAALFTGDVSSASTVVIAVPTFLLQSHYSRGFEEEADAFAFSTLAAHKISPAWFAEAMRKLDSHYAVADEGEDGAAYLSSHPRTPARIAAAEASGETFLAAYPDLASETPGYDPCANDGKCEDDEEDVDLPDCEDIQCLLDRAKADAESDPDAGIDDEDD